MKLPHTLRRLTLVLLSLIAAAGIIVSSCGRSIFPSAASTSGTSESPLPTGSLVPTSTPAHTISPSPGFTPTPIPTPLPTTQAFAFVTNHGDGKVSVFARDPVSGALTLKSTAEAGDPNGPKGIAVLPNKRAVYVVNHAEGKIYQYRFDSAVGALVPMTPARVGSASDSGPQMVAIDPSGKYLFATNSGNGTVVSYAIDQDTGALTPVASLALRGDSEPFGIVADHLGRYLYVSDEAQGLIETFSYDRSGALAKIGDGIESLGSSSGHPGTLALGRGSAMLYAVDSITGGISVFSAVKGKLTFIRLLSANSKAEAAIGLAVLTRTTSEDLLFEPMQSTNTIQLLSEIGSAVNQPSFASGPEVSAPTSAATDGAGHLYITNQGNGTVSMLGFGRACRARKALCLKQTIPSENPGNSASQPFWIALTH